MNGISRACLIGVLLASFTSAGANASWDFATANPYATVAGASACSCDNCDPQLVDSLTEQLGIAQRQHVVLREKLLRIQHHRPVVIANPLGGLGSTAWQVVSTALAMLCIALCTHSHGTKSKASKKMKELQQVMQLKEALWRKDMTNQQTQFQQQVALHQRQEQAWKQGIQQLSQLVQQRSAAVVQQEGAVSQSQDCVMPLQQVGVSFKTRLWTRHINAFGTLLQLHHQVRQSCMLQLEESASHTACHGLLNALLLNC